MSRLVDLQTAIAARLTAVDTTVPAPVPVNGSVQWITENIGDLVNIVQRATAKIGIVGIVMTPQGKLFKANQGPSKDVMAMIEVQIQENVVMNRGPTGTQITATTLIDFVMDRLRWFKLGGQRARHIELDEVPWILLPSNEVLCYNVRAHAPL